MTTSEPARNHDGRPQDDLDIYPNLLPRSGGDDIGLMKHRAAKKKPDKEDPKPHGKEDPTPHVGDDIGMQRLAQEVSLEPW